MPGVTRVKAGFILAGGSSSRMGRDKALLPWRGATLLDHVAAVVRDAAGSLSLVGAPGRYRDRGYPEIADLFPGAGPLGGVITALRASDANFNLIVACDMPGITVSFLGDLLRDAQQKDADCLLPIGPSGLAEPLCAVWHRRSETALTRALEAGIRKMTDAIAELGVVRRLVGSLSALENVNTPQDWAIHSGHEKPV